MLSVCVSVFVARACASICAVWSARYAVLMCVVSVMRYLNGFVWRNVRALRGACAVCHCVSVMRAWRASGVRMRCVFVCTVCMCLCVGCLCAGFVRAALVWAPVLV